MALENKRVLAIGAHPDNVDHQPPLRERRTDIPLLAENFLRRAVPEGERPLRLSDEALSLDAD